MIIIPFLFFTIGYIKISKAAMYNGGMKIIFMVLFLCLIPEEAGFFSKTAEVHCNAQGSPLRLTMSGMAVSSGQQ
jgi:hypothetical protein